MTLHLTMLLVIELILEKKSSSVNLKTEASDAPITRRCGLMSKLVARQSLMKPELITKPTTRFRMKDSSFSVSLVPTRSIATSMKKNRAERNAMGIVC
jgi:hypothetical protein